MAAPDPLPGVESALCQHFAQRPVRASISFVGVQPLEVLRFEPIPGERAYVSLGMSREAMSDAASPLVDAAGPRAELMLHVRDAIDEHAGVWRQLAVLAAGPVVEGLVYAPGVSVDLARPLVAGSRCTGGIVTGSALGVLATAAGEVAILQVLPATSNELAWARAKGHDALRTRWREHGVDLLDLTRLPVDLG